MADTLQTPALRQDQPTTHPLILNQMQTLAVPMDDAPAPVEQVTPVVAAVPVVPPELARLHAAIHGETHDSRHMTWVR